MTTVHTYLSKTCNTFCRALKVSLVIIIIACFIPRYATAQQTDDYDEVEVIVNVQRIGNTEISSLIFKEEAYLSIKELFNFLKIRVEPSADDDSLRGFFIDKKASYVFDKINNRITYQDKIFNLTGSALIKTPEGLYLKSNYFGEVFGLDCSFNFRSLSITLNTKIELPAIREMQQEFIRKNLYHLKGTTKADSILINKKNITSFGIADWSIISTQQNNGGSNTRLDLALGAMVAGGETNVLLSANSSTPLDARQQYYRWRRVNNNSTAFKQVVVGKLITPSISSIFSNVVGVQFTNAPATYRKSFGSYRLNSNTEPGWLVELYVNNVLVNYVRADASGFFSFDVPLVYGNSIVRLKFYGPWGEERVKEENISIPFNFLPAKQFEYSHSTGMVEDGEQSLFSRTAFNYGLKNNLTIGAGVEYLSSVATGKTMPFANASYRIKSNLLLSGDYTFGVRARAVLSYRLPSNFQVDAEYNKYDKNQQAIRFNYLEERKVAVTMPFRGKGFTAFSRFTFNQIILQKGKNTAGEWLVSAVTPKFSANITTYTMLQDKNIANAYSNISLSFRVPGGIRLQPQVRYQYDRHSINNVRFEAEKRLFQKGFLNVTYEKNFILNMPSVNIGFRYDLSFAQTLFSVQKSKQSTTTLQSARGSLWFDKSTKNIEGSSRANVGRGAIVIVPFIDENGNNIHDKNEHRAFGLKVRINGGFREQNADSTVRITGLEAYRNYMIEFDKNSFENIAWRISTGSMSVEILPNYTKLIEVPVKVLGEAAGTVFMQKRKSKKGQSRMMISILNEQKLPVAKVLSEADGYFSYLGLAPGSYTAKLNESQLKEMNLRSIKDEVAFSIARNIDGDVVDGLEFIVRPLLDSLYNLEDEEKQPIKETSEEAQVENRKPVAATITTLVHTATKVIKKPVVKSTRNVSFEKRNIVAGKNSVRLTGKNASAVVQQIRSSKGVESTTAKNQEIKIRRKSNKVVSEDAMQLFKKLEKMLSGIQQVLEEIPRLIMPIEKDKQRSKELL